MLLQITYNLYGSSGIHIMDEKTKRINLKWVKRKRRTGKKKKKNEREREREYKGMPHNHNCWSSSLGGFVFIGWCS